MEIVYFYIFFRVFSDRLIDDTDMDTFVNILSDKLGTLFEQTFHNICPNKQPPIFGKYTYCSLSNYPLSEFENKFDMTSFPTIA